ncbi:MAG: carboxy terminal-processing peptidase [Saprospiraceae bacterium]|nr:carboxy terminal-processing peptidase [Saprospiraceae bacterium]MCF8250872.1 carboxy terminal-processing peptidase [Saprospiraceae bacterium]MCF8312727.1 carboxy terminal-processing peptidase [Saprospiraceae bacterium]MCF8441174.1 carboxy terminal-processing peptidase [Saprospiraceae bacterium]
MLDHPQQISFLNRTKEVIMKNKGLLLTLVAAAGLFLAFYFPVNTAQKEATLMQSILTDLNYYHYQPLEVNDNLSEKLYGLFLDRMDGSRRWLTQADVAKLDAWKQKLDNEANDGTFAFLDQITQMQQAGIKKTQAWYREFLDKPFDFKQNESVETDGDKKPFAKNDQELKEYWRKQLKWETLSRLTEKLEKKEKGDADFKDKTYEELEADARKEGLKVYDDWYDRLGKRKRNEFLSLYLDTFTNVFDPHSNYLEPIDKQNFDIQMSGRLEGIGARLQTDGESTKVSEVIVGGPAWKQGMLKDNDKILKVKQDGEAEWTDLTGMVINDVVQLIRGKPGTKVILFIKKAEGGTTEEVTIERDIVILEEGFAKSLLIDSPQKEKIGYIRLLKFYADFNNKDGRRCAEDIAVELEKLKQANVQGIILDLRGNGGGSLRDVVKMGGFFVEEGPIVQVKSRSRNPEVLTDDDPSVQYKGALIVMVDQFSASASEILAAALQDYGRAIIVGTGNSTFGKGTVQRFFDLDAVVRNNPEVKPLGEVKLTVQKFFRVNGGSTQLKGVIPDIILPSNWLYVETGEKEEEFPMEWTQIDPVPYAQNVYSLSGLPKIKEMADTRIKNNEVFQVIDQRAKRLKELRDDTDHTLNLDEYLEENKKLDEEDSSYTKLFDREVLTSIQNLPVDMTSINADESKKARNEEWLKGVKKDVYLLETLNIMHDLMTIN